MSLRVAINRGNRLYFSMIATLEPRNGKIDKIWVFMGIQNIFIFIQRGG